jgi:hypothetical protein
MKKVRILASHYFEERERHVWAILRFLSKVFRASEERTVKFEPGAILEARARKRSERIRGVETAKVGDFSDFVERDGITIVLSFGADVKFYATVALQRPCSIGKKENNVRSLGVKRTKNGGWHSQFFPRKKKKKL